ncbi:CrcB family protein [Gulosibacter macacae]|uniref:Fluoride-specific ion channel n=1 Tax=Gulosibacter macacae TaxID=2488791 RepID=A0A3P3VW77_9MICO|nr:CrcB family protein [Gulosibacter macacae]RRJ87045.1 CrcB family protein [Gulosibacter macacae]
MINVALRPLGSLEMLLVVMIGGLGAAARYLVDMLLQERAGLRPWTSIMLINAFGSTLLGSTLALMHTDAWLIWFLVSVFAGGFTTLSTTMLHAFLALAERAFVRAIVIALGQLIGCCLLAWLAFVAVRALLGL